MSVDGKRESVNIKDSTKVIKSGALGFSRGARDYAWDCCGIVKWLREIDRGSETHKFDCSILGSPLPRVSLTGRLA